MSDLGNKIRELRKKKGFSQEELADFSKVNLRTIQRIENNESEPRGKTINLICNVLEVDSMDILDYGKHENNNFLFYFHLSALSFFLIPMGNILVPLILWLTNKDKIIKLKSIGANLINFQIIWTVCSSGSIILFALFKIMHYKFFFIFIGIWIFLCLINVVLPIVFAIKTKKGSIKCVYPTILKLIR